MGGLLLTVGVVALLVLLHGCRTPEASAKNSTMPNFGPNAPDVRTEALIIQMENQYIADKNDQPTHQHEVEAAKKKKAAELQAQKAREQKAQEQAAQEKQAAEEAK